MAYVVNPASKQPVAVNQDGEVDSLTRRVVWNDFLRKMKDDLGISAEDVLSAFQSLSQEDMAKPPEQTVDKVVMAMGLDGQQAQIAKQYFTELINKTKPGSMGEELADSQKHISLTLMSQRELSRRGNNKAVDNIQQKFFMNGSYPRPQEAVAAAPAGTAPYIPKAVVDEDGYVSYVNPQEQQQAAGQDPMLAPSAMAPVTAGAKAAPNSARIDANPKMTEALEKMQPQDAADKSLAEVDGLIKKFMAGQAQSAQVPQAAIPAAVAGGGSAAGHATAAAIPAAQMMVNQFLGKDAGSSKDSGEESGYTADASYLAGLNGEQQNARAANGPSDFQQQLSSVAPAPPMAVPDLVQNAQVLVRDGGGEMKVTLTPDGLGEVAMKVSVQDGKVNVQMITESDEAKKLIERQLGELKSSLTGHHLQVTEIKVDTATNIGKQMEQQYQDAQRQQAQQTLEQYRQDQQGWRKSFFEVPAAKIYKGQNEAPRDVQAPSSASSRRAGSRRLDLVA